MISNLVNLLCNYLKYKNERRKKTKQMFLRRIKKRFNNLFQKLPQCYYFKYNIKKIINNFLLIYRIYKLQFSDDVNNK